MNLEDVVGKYVNVYCFDGRVFNHFYVYGYSDAYDNDEPFEESIDLLEKDDAIVGIFLYRSEIKRIEIIN